MVFYCATLHVLAYASRQG